MSGLVEASSLKEFFKVLLGEAITRRQVQLGEATEFYLVNLLSDFASSDKLFNDESGGKRDHEPLAILYHRALQQERDQRIRTLRRLGDVSLYKAGFFADSLRDGVVGPDYYINMGGAAYAQVASLAPQAFGGVYDELHRKFRSLVNLLEEISARQMVGSGPQGAIRVFETWVRTGNDRLEQVLVDAGVVAPKSHLPN